MESLWYFPGIGMDIISTSCHEDGIFPDTQREFSEKGEVNFFLNVYSRADLIHTN